MALLDLSTQAALKIQARDLRAIAKGIAAFAEADNPGAIRLNIRDARATLDAIEARLPEAAR